MFQAALILMLLGLSVTHTLCRSAQLHLTTRPEYNVHTSDNDLEQLLQVSCDGSVTCCSQFNLNQVPDVNSTSNLVFETIRSLLQHWPNTNMRNGHTIIPGTIPPRTVLYHGTWHKEIPTGPEWAAFDPEHSFLFCGNVVGEEGCWHLTVITTRPLKVLYFDGTSSARLPFGTMDTQDMVAWGEIKPSWLKDDQRRTMDLCAWGRKYAVDGFVRMEMDFELVLCNFTNSVDVVSFLNLADSNRVTHRKNSPRLTESIYAGMRYNHYPGLSRLHLDLSGLISFYDTDLFPSLVSARFGRERWEHRIQNISQNDATRFQTRLYQVLTRDPGHLTSGIDWMALIHVIVNHYSERLELVQHFLYSINMEKFQDMFENVNKTQTQLRVMLTPYILSNVTPQTVDMCTEGTRRQALDWAKPVFHVCATTLMNRFVLGVPMTDSERLLSKSIWETKKEICRVVTKMWASGVVAGVDGFLPSVGVVEPNSETMGELVESWKVDLDELMGWLDWSVWLKCKPSCGPEEICYITTWPVGFPLNHWPDIPAPSSGPIMEPILDPPPGTEVIAEDWERPRPRCIKWINSETQWA